MKPHRNAAARPPVTVLLGVLAAVAVVAPDPASAQFDGPAAEEVRAREQAFAKSMADRDLDAFGTFIAPDAIFFGAQATRGRDAIVALWAAYFEGETAPFSWEPDQVQVLDSGELALSTGAVRNPQGEVVGRFNSIWKRDADGIWRVVFDKGS